jgi:hypothetical protein
VEKVNRWHTGYNCVLTFHLEGLMPSQKFKDMFKEKPFVQIDLDEYWNAPSTKGWENKPHRYLYDCLREIYHLRLELKKHTG